MADVPNKLIEENFVITQDFLEVYKNHPIIKNCVKDYFYKFPMHIIPDMIEDILLNKPIIFTDYVPKTHHGFSKIKKKMDDNYKFLPFYYIELRNKIIEKLNILIVGFDEINEGCEIYKKRRFMVTKNATKGELFKIFCDEDGDCDFFYNFKEKDLEFSIPGTSNNLQLVRIQISSPPISFGVAVEHQYQCPDKHAINEEDICDSPMIISKKVYEVESVKDKIICPGKMYYTTSDGKEKNRRCGKGLNPIERRSTFANGYYYDINYENNDGMMKNSGAFSFKELMPGYYEAVLFSNIGNYKMQNFQIVDVSSIENMKFNIPEKKEGVNYLLTLQEAIDDFIHQQCGVRIYGLVPLKICFLLQKLATIFDIPLNYNIDFTGSKSVGKSLLMKYYGIMLYNYGFIGTNGLSVSVPALRGTTDKVLVMSKEVTINRMGYLGTYKNIHIDEVGENPELIQHLKIFLMESNYSNNMARADGISRKRTAHINLTKNLNNEHLGQYRGGIKKMYDNLQAKDGIPLHPWNYNWDLFQPIESYDDTYLKSCIKKQRDKFFNSQKWWIDGCDLPLHDRFPFYFYVEDDNNKNLHRTVMENCCKKNIEEFMQLIKHLKNSDVDEFLKTFIISNDETLEEDSFTEVDKILDDYLIVVDSRIKKIYYMVVKLSMIINRRKIPNTEDYDLLRYILENINRKVTTTEIEKYQIRGPYIVKYHNIIDEYANKDFALQSTDDEDVQNDFK
jgi:hypothetical protein